MNILIRGSNKGTVSSTDGTYKLEATRQATLVFSSIGYLTKEVMIEAQSVVNIVLEYDNKALNEVVKVGYGSQAKWNITGAVQDVKAKELQDILVA